MRPPEPFSTPRLLARKPRVSDAPAVFAAYASDPLVTRFLAWKAYSEIAPLEKFLQARVDDWELENNRYGYLLCLPETDTPLVRSASISRATRLCSATSSGALIGAAV